MRCLSVVIRDPIHEAFCVEHPNSVCMLINSTPNDFSTPPISVVMIKAPGKISMNYEILALPAHKTACYFFESVDFHEVFSHLLKPAQSRYRYQLWSDLSYFHFSTSNEVLRLFGQ